MNDHPESFPDTSDNPTLDEMLSRLKRIEPPLETRVGNRMAVAAELSSLLAASRRNRLPWWRRSIPIPVPIAAGVAASLIVLAGFAVQSNFRGGEERSATAVAGHDKPAEHAVDPAREKTAIARHARDAQPVLEYRETATYLCGVGQLSSESGYFLTRSRTDD